MQALGFTGPFSGRKHQFMVRKNRIVRIPNPHQSDISAGLVSEILRQADITRDEWHNAEAA